MITYLTSRGIPQEQADQFYKYFQLLTDWNTRMNLTAITEEREVADKHFLDCAGIFSCGKIADGASVIDVGAGAGFPSLPMKILNPTLDVTMLDSLQKRVGFLDAVIDELGLSGIRAVHARAEDGARQADLREQFDVCVARAVANLATLAELCLPFVKKGGYFIAMKGPVADQEVEEGKRAIQLLGGKVEEVCSYRIPDTDLDHRLVVVKKVSQTSPKYPRKAPKPSREPLK
ncbi:MAG: 16S rRNA (guanine(527)-N(7))-methyltransferase RsmG [Ruminococcaceae bacterium]|nr:16S rRNA (guanine(527)-N(7))-methyltransferase RsmG [Oscillospiraceae bacterium]